MGSAYIDGSSVYDLDIYAAVNNCKAKGYNEEDIVVDALLTSGGTLNKEEINLTERLLKVGVIDSAVQPGETKKLIGNYFFF